MKSRIEKLIKVIPIEVIFTYEELVRWRLMDAADEAVAGVDPWQSEGS